MINSENTYRSELRERILAIATQMLTTRGIRKVKMDDIANRLKISKRTLYEVYQNKEDLVLEVLQRNDEEKRKRLKQFDRPGSTVIDIITRFLRQKTEESSKVNPEFMEDMERYPKLRNFLREKRKLHSAQTMDFMRRGIREGYFMPDINYELVIQLIDTSVYHVMNHYSKEKYDLRDLLRTFTCLYIRSVCTPKGVELLDKSMKKI